MLVPISIFYIALGLLCGSLFNVKQVGGVCGALLTNLSAWLSGVWFDIELMGDGFGKIANLLPFIHSVELERAMISGSSEGVLLHICFILGYGIALTIAAITIFLMKMKDR